MTFFSNLFEWLKISNRSKHVKAGIIIFIIWITVVQTLTSMSILQTVFTGTCCVFVAMCSVEYIQKTSGSKWDWLDVLAGILVPGILTLIFWLWILFSL